MHCLQNMNIFTLILLTLGPKLGPDCGNGDGDGKKFGGDGRGWKALPAGMGGDGKNFAGTVGMESKVAGTGGDGCKLLSPCSSLIQTESSMNKHFIT